MNENNIYIFTFHHVSIKTLKAIIAVIGAYIFTFHHVSIKTFLQNVAQKYSRYLHSTMYLLKHCKI